MVIKSGRWVFKCGGDFQRDCNASNNTGMQSSGKGNQSKSWSKSESSITSKGKSEENKYKSKGFKGATGSGKGKNLENRYLSS